MQMNVVMMVPGSDVEGTVLLVLYIALALKLIDVGHLLVVQCTTDVFLIDWEKPRDLAQRRVVLPESDASGTTRKGRKSDRQSGNAWRTTFIANEWCEIQTQRKIKVAIQLIFVLFLLDGIGLINLASAVIKTRHFSIAKIITADRMFNIFLRYFSFALKLIF